MQAISGRGKIVSQAFLFLNGAQFKAKPTYKIHIISQYYISYCMLKHLFEITSSTHTHA
jgi:hypothetical protein